MSHEIRKPMNGILGFSSLLSEPELDKEEQQEYIKGEIWLENQQGVGSTFYFTLPNNIKKRSKTITS